VSARRVSFTERLARRSARHPWRALIVWLAIAGAAALVYGFGSDLLVATESFLTRPESQRVEQLVSEHLPGSDAATEVVVVSSPTRTLADADGVFMGRVAELAKGIEAIGDEHIAGVVSVAGVSGAAGEAMAEQAVAAQAAAGESATAGQGATSGDASSQAAASGSQTEQSAAEALAATLVSADGRTTLMLVSLAGSASESDEHIDRLYDLVRAQDGRDGFDVSITGAGTWERETKDLAASDLRRGELIGVPIALVVLVLVFGAVAAALVPLALAAVAIALALALTVLLGAGFDVSVFAVNVVTMIGLAVGIDYSLLIVSRYREERRAGHDVGAAVARAGATASRAVLFSGGIVVVALTGMLVVPFSIFTSLGAGAIFVVGAAVIAALSLLPAVLRLLGDRIDRLRVRRSPGRFAEDGHPDSLWTRIARTMMRRPLVSLAVSCGVLLLLAVPMLHMQTGMPGVREFPDSTSGKRAFTVLKGQFSAGLTSPIVVAIDGKLTDPQVAAALKKLQAAAAADGRFETVGFQKTDAGDFALLKLAVNDDPTSGKAMDAVRDLRSTLVPEAVGDAPVEVLVGGVPGLYTDVIDLIDSFTPWVIGIVLALSFVLLLFAFRSLVIAVQAILMNLLSVGAAYGLVTLVFQDGVGAGLLGFTSVERILAWLPLLMFCVLFGLSMDYHIFLLSRIRERYDQSGDTRDAVVFGVGSTGGIITGAALIMVAVFAGVAMGDMTMFQQLGFGLAVAIAIDATIVRVVTVPATMTLLGRASWYLPRWLEWLPQVKLDEAAVTDAPSPVTDEPWPAPHDAQPAAHDPWPARHDARPARGDDIDVAVPTADLQEAERS
jgi:RND superfamily putative drug exporter